jgi:phosphotransferase family enzyme
MTTSHERYHDVLAALADDAVLLPLVCEAGARFGSWTAERTWRRTSDRFMPDGYVLATVVFASDRPSQEVCRVDVVEQPAKGSGSTDRVCDIDTNIGCVRVMRFPFDPALPGLATIASPRDTVVRYHPGKRCTFRTVIGGGTVFGKVYATNTGARVYRDLASLQRARSRGELTVAIAEPLSWDPETRTLRQTAVTGQPAIEGLCGANGAQFARRMGGAAASLSGTTVIPQDVFDDAGAMARSRRHAADLVRRVPDVAGIVTVTLERLAETHARFPTHERRCVHGAMHPDQWLDAGTELGLIDFDRCAGGDPEMDAGIVLADLEALRAPAVPPAQLAAAFLEGYRDGGAALREPLVHAYRVHQLLAKALRAARAIRPDGDRRAAKAAARAEAMSREAVLA